MSVDPDPRRRASDYEPQVISKAEMRALFEEAADKVIYRTFENLGVDINSPEDRRAVREDFAWVRAVRRGSADAARTVRNAGIVVLCGVLLTALGIGVKTQLGSPG